MVTETQLRTNKMSIKPMKMENKWEKKEEEWEDEREKVDGGEATDFGNLLINGKNGRQKTRHARAVTPRWITLMHRDLHSILQLVDFNLTS